MQLSLLQRTFGTWGALCLAGRTAPSLACSAPPTVPHDAPRLRNLPLQIRVHAGRLLGTQSLARHVGWKGEEPHVLCSNVAFFSHVQCTEICATAAACKACLATAPRGGVQRDTCLRESASGTRPALAGSPRTLCLPNALAGDKAAVDAQRALHLRIAGKQLAVSPCCSATKSRAAAVCLMFRPSIAMACMLARAGMLTKLLAHTSRAGSQRGLHCCAVEPTRLCAMLPPSGCLKAGLLSNVSPTLMPFPGCPAAPRCRGHAVPEEWSAG